VNARRAVVLAAAGYVLLGLLGFTGGSGLVAVRHDGLAPGAPGREEILGTSQGIRSDEWAVETAIARSQQLSDPSFPLVNLDIGLGQLARSPYTVPVLDWGAPLRPLTWPLFLGSPWSFGVRWFLRSALALLGLYVAMRVVAGVGTRGLEHGAERDWIAAVAAVAVTYSSGFQWWLSTALPEIVGYVGLAMGAASRHAGSQSRRARVLWLALTLYALACALFHFYPPVWGPVLWLFLGTVFDLHWSRFRSVTRSARAMLPVAIGTAAVALLSIAYYLPYLSLVSATAYPGRRVAEAGGLGLDRLLDLAWPSLRVLARTSEQGLYLGRERGMNVCEASAVEALPLLALAASALVSARVRHAFRGVVRDGPGSALAWSVLAAWIFVPLPAWTGTVTLLRWSPGYRAWFAFGVTSALLATRLLAELLDARPERERPVATVAAGGLALVASLLLAVPLVDVPRERGALASYAAPLLLSGGLALAGLAALRGRWAPRFLALGWALPLVVANAPANPLVRSNDVFATGAGHAAVTQALRETPGRMLDYSTHVGSVRAGSGWPVLAAVYVAPDRALFRFLAPDSPGLEESVSNRYAHVSFVLPQHGTRLLQPDAFRLGIWPCSPRLATLGVNHVLAAFSKDLLGVACGSSFTQKKVGALWLWTRREPADSWGIAPAVPWPSSALQFDFRRRAGGEPPVLERRRSGLGIRVPGDPRTAYAFAVNLSVLGEPECVDAFARAVDTHLVVTATSGRPGRCDVPYLGTLEAFRTLISERGNARASPEP
jgi:hypothetical protein